ncbi:hypothetical protein PZA11_002272 [Diplocarpon coronariae]|uniref:Uncharacterized protein n=1 Tax=Diplocarpon coronariae TaxID=2795749 RepID=A0A218YZC1_9HELO|nr:hypothetical protein JHW43_005279 [Diplocarpon mali]OWP00784.1 hypothetical protein B2J93_8475 [Marssonina coronariae]
MSEVYKKIGRGGAGNYCSKQDLVQAAKNSDLESASQHPSSSPSATSAPAPGYLHTGRGGAGNRVQASELISSGLTPSQSTSDPTSTSKPAAGEASAARVMGSSKPTYRGGRGGAGNYYNLTTDPEREERLQAEGVARLNRAWAEGEAQRALMRPEEAYQGSGRSGRGMDRDSWVDR